MTKETESKDNRLIERMSRDFAKSFLEKFLHDRSVADNYEPDV